MFWIEEVDKVKEKFTPADFKDPFTEGNKIIEKIIVRLLHTTWLNFHNSLNREELLTKGQLLKTCTIKELYYNELPKLKNDTNFWLLLVNIPLGTDFRIYDCKLEPLIELVHLSSLEPKREFYIVDKKYSWFLFFKVDKMNDLVEIYEQHESPMERN